MKLLWLSARRMGEDLASSTEYNLCNGLSRLDIEVTLISPGVVENGNFRHHQIRDVRFPGLSSFTGSRKAIREVKNLGIGNFDMLLVDWRYIFSISKYIGGFSIPWVIVDRGPPAKKGPLNRLQKIQWYRAWKLAGKKACGGLVVSKKHGDFVRGLTGIDLDLDIVPAGTRKNPFPLEKGDPGSLLILSYIGQIDKRRDVGEIFNLSDSLTKRGVKHRIEICGDGDMVEEFSKSSDSNDAISYLGKKTEEEVFRLLSKSHVGIMPMPDIPVWRISSTLKLANYLASGLAVIGSNHAGNRTSNPGGWNFLSEGDWSDRCSRRISEEINNGWSNIVSSATKESNSLSWDKISKDLLDNLKKK